VSCEPERVTAYVDRELPAPIERAVEFHLTRCPGCATQAAFEVDLRATLHTLPAPLLRAASAARVLHEALTGPRALAAH